MFFGHMKGGQGRGDVPLPAAVLQFWGLAPVPSGGWGGWRLSAQAEPPGLEAGWAEIPGCLWQEQPGLTAPWRINGIKF